MRIWLRATINTLAVLPELHRRARKEAREARRREEEHAATLAYSPTLRDRTAAHLMDASLLVATPAFRGALRKPLRQAVFDLMLTKNPPITEDEES